MQLAAVADHRPVVGDAEQRATGGSAMMRIAEPCSSKLALSGTDVDLAGPHDLPGIGLRSQLSGCSTW